MAKTCGGPGQYGKKRCGRRVRCKGLCNTHYYHWLHNGQSEEGLKPINGPAGKRVDNPQTLTLTGLDADAVDALAALGEKVAPTDSRQVSAPIRALRHFTRAVVAGEVTFTGEYQLAKE